MPRQARLDVEGTLHHVIIRGIEERRIVDDEKDRENFIKRLRKIWGRILNIKYRPRKLCGQACLLTFGSLPEFRHPFILFSALSYFPCRIKRDRWP
ncbi:MAG: hypothetical protein HY882_11130 [Deltaproteobacteria bacterium]|nr:hypothetical protein [Deltaproteobacteria bacterium]